MSDFFVVNRQTMENILDCFSDTEEFIEFAEDMTAMITEILKCGNQICKHEGNDEVCEEMVLKQLFMLSLFFRRNFDVIKELVRVVDYTLLDSEQMKQQYPDHKIT